MACRCIVKTLTQKCVPANSTTTGKSVTAGTALGTHCLLTQDWPAASPAVAKLH